MSSQPGNGVLKLALPSDPALALTARMFAGALGDHLDGAVPADLKLAFSELLAAAVDAGEDQVRFRVDLGRAEVEVRGVGRIDVEGGNHLGEDDRFVRKYRSDLLRALFPGLRDRDGVVVVPLRGSA